MTEIFQLSIKEASYKTEEYCQLHFPARYARACKCVSADERLRSIGVGILEYEVLGLDEKDIRLGEHGKPYSDKCAKHFSVSHSGDYTLLAVSDENVGIDIEKADRGFGIKAEKVFTDEELEWLKTEPENGFLRLWTMKEALSKIVGTGLGMRFNIVNVLPLVLGESMSFKGHKLKTVNYEIPDYVISTCIAED